MLQTISQKKSFRQIECLEKHTFDLINWLNYVIHYLPGPDGPVALPLPVLQPVPHGLHHVHALLVGLQDLVIAACRHISVPGVSCYAREEGQRYY